MTKLEAVREWRGSFLRTIRERENGSPDYPMRRESWNLYVDSLREEGRITDTQYDEWLPPAECR